MNSTCNVSVRVILAQGWNYTQTVENGTTVTIWCNMGVTFPEWRGPPVATQGTSTVYNYQYMSIFNHFGNEKLSRLSWAANNRDLRLSPVTKDDEGTYQCCYRFQIWMVNLLVRGMQNHLQFIHR